MWLLMGCSGIGRGRTKERGGDVVVWKSVVIERERYVDSVKRTDVCNKDGLNGKEDTRFRRTDLLRRPEQPKTKGLASSPRMYLDHSMYDRYISTRAIFNANFGEL